jgi:ATP-dependent Clp protease ATP-binding subunit ClpC
VSYQDRTVTCQDCGQPFVFTAGEQAFYASKGIKGVPKRCPQCRVTAGRASAVPIVAFVERFDEAGRRALAYAEEEARQLEHRWIGTEHLLLGLLRDSEGAGGRALRRLGIDLDETRAAVVYWARAIPPDAAPRGATAATESIGLAARAKLALDLAAADAKTQPQGRAGSEHLLLALLRGQDENSPGRGVAAAILHGFGVTAEQVQAALPHVLAGDTASVGDEAAAGPEHPYRLAGAGKWEEATQSLAQWRDQRRKGRRYSLVLPDGLFEEVERLAERQHTSVVELLRRFTRLGLLAMELQDRPDAALIIREGATERQLVLL